MKKIITLILLIISINCYSQSENIFYIRIHKKIINKKIYSINDSINNFYFTEYILPLNKENSKLRALNTKLKDKINITNQSLNLILIAQNNINIVINNQKIKDYKDLYIKKLLTEQNNNYDSITQPITIYYYRDRSGTLIIANNLIDVFMDNK